ncbi:hypothetical protein, partial [Klebsiella pneumoniae]|uniref:hypothetical protein n=1 Tax=Klebsiella pneumoniae TaxID=573 RepID=UPI003D05E698
SLKTSIKTITYLSDIGCLEIQGASLYGMPALTSVVPKLSVTVTSVGTTMTRVNARGVLTKSDKNNGYDFIFLSVNLGGLVAGDVVYITGVNIEIPKRA